MSSPGSSDTDTSPYTYFARRTPRFKNYAGEADPHDSLKQDATYKGNPQESTVDERTRARKKPRQRTGKDAIPKRLRPAKKTPDSRYRSAPILDDDEPIRGQNPCPSKALQPPPAAVNRIRLQRANGSGPQVTDANNEANHAEDAAQENEPIQNPQQNNILRRLQSSVENPRRRPPRGPTQAS
ncbi:hypothetical protein DPSP01_007920 [Paraphaeosphaeria sporulosa]|uniref:Uncharacterized protein n=1 Tax=Paraphaeosphaeria sporulosa TaxID=1460663 RepID=A0A177CK85_9PLEO|nr:uncharacterized protein CC84DRAFT_1242628 [Paraphaeosphaeria sporulosa]OAG07259.1 hypothetical protein CC84DRAFT_1242628 [Paraphaeosphaeria sporulosa]